MKNLDIDEFFGSLSAFSGMQKRRDQPDLQKEKSFALMVEKVMKRMNIHEEDDSEDDECDRELALITESIKKFLK